MFETFLNRLFRVEAEAETLPDPDARLALGALMVRVARADRHYGAPEAREIEQQLAQHYALSMPEAAALREQAEILESEAPDTVRFTRAIKDAVIYEERAWVLEALWSVALADGRRAHEEDAVLRLASSLLGVRDQDSAHARRRVQGRDAGSA